MLRCHFVKSGNFDRNKTKNQTLLKEKSDIRPWSAKADHSGRTGNNFIFTGSSKGCSKNSKLPQHVDEEEQTSCKDNFTPKQHLLPHGSFHSAI